MYEGQMYDVRFMYEGKATALKRALLLFFVKKTHIYLHMSKKSITFAS